MRTAIFLSARSKSTRLPDKAFRLIQGRSTTAHLIDRLKLAKIPESIILTTSTDPADETLCELASEHGIASFKGDEDDKLERYRSAAEAFDLDAFAVVDGDDLFCSEIHLDRALRLMIKSDADFVTQRGLPIGSASFCVSRNAIERVCREKDSQRTEVWGAYFTESGRFHCEFVDDKDLKWPEGLRMTLDYEEDLAFFMAVIEGTYQRERDCPSFVDLIGWITENKHVVELNRFAQARYESNIQRAAPPKFKAGPAT